MNYELYELLIPPLVGGIIGYFTNDIAIRMLFRPRKAIYIGKWKLPFTPGVIVKEKPRIAKSVGDMISSELLDSDTVQEMLISDEIKQKLRNTIQKMIEENRNNEETLETALLHFTSEEKAEAGIKTASSHLIAAVQNKILEKQLNEVIYQYIRQKIKDYNEAAWGLVKNIGVKRMIDQCTFDLVVDAIPEFINKETDQLMQVRVCDLIKEHEEKLPVLTERMIGLYDGVIERYMHRILQGINLSKIVEEKINAFDAAELEDLIFGLMKRELNAIIRLGALLGFLMGWINVFI